VSQPTVEAPPRPADEHQVGQAALVSLIPALLREAWPLLDLHNLQATMPQFTAAVRAVVQRYGQASAAGALAYYQTERAAANVPGRPSLKLAPSPADSVIESAVSWATTDLFGPVTTETTDAAMARLDESVSQMVLDQGRATIIGAVKQDKYAKGWARVTEPGACSFCIMLALRAGAGMLYKRQSGADFQAHDHCRCHAEPVWNAYEPSARMREAQATWVDATKGRYGADARAAFRQAREGRPVTGTTGPLKKAATLGKSTMTRPQVEHLLGVAQGLKDSPYRTGQIARLSKLLAGK
jgi:hypothetical protein